MKSSFVILKVESDRRKIRRYDLCIFWHKIFPYFPPRRMWKEHQPGSQSILQFRANECVSESAGASTLLALHCSSFAVESFVPCTEKSRPRSDRSRSVSHTLVRSFHRDAHAACSHLVVFAVGVSLSCRLGCCGQAFSNRTCNSIN